MTAVDWVIVMLVLFLALQGYVRGFIVGVAALIGFVVGAVAGSRIGPLLLSHGSGSPSAPLFALGGSLLLGTLLGGLCESVARRGRRLLWFAPLRMADGFAGAVLTACTGLGLAWIAGAALVQGAPGLGLPPGLRRALQHSVILRALNQTLPPSGSILNALARVDPFPSVTGRVARVPAPDPRVPASAGVRRAAASVVRVTGSACGLGIEGSGWTAAAGLVITNAHVVAGETDTVVQVRGTGPRLPTRVVVFDAHNDLAVLRVGGLSLRPLALAGAPAPGTAGAVLGYPLNGAFNAQPARLGDTAYTATDNAYGDPTVRDISSMRGLVRPGNSGGPLIDAAGRVMGTVFAQITNAPAGQPGGLTIPNSVVSGDLGRARAAHRAVSTGACAD